MSNMVAADRRSELNSQLAHLLRHLQRSGITHVSRAAENQVEQTLLALGIPLNSNEPPNTAASIIAKATPITDPPRSSTPLIATNPRRPDSKAPSLGVPSKPIGDARWLSAAVAADRRPAALQVLAEQVASCHRCDELSCKRRQTVFGEGNPVPRVCFFGEAPGADEDRVGRPFVGAAGKLFDRIILASTFRREDVYILNTVKCRPPENRNPTDVEVANCREYFEAQFELLQPEFVVCLGLVAARALLKEAPSVGRLRGRFHRFRGAQVIVTYHPSYLLRTPSAKAATWEDMKMLLRAMDIELPERG